LTTHFGRALAALCVAAGFMMCTGCAGFWDLPTTTSSTVTSTTLSSGYFYILDSATSQIISYAIESGTLTEIASYAPPSSPLAIAVAPDNDYLFVSTTSGIYSYTISDGELTLASDAVSTDPAVAMQVDADSEWLIETSAAGYLYAIPVLTSSGQLDSSRSTAELSLSSSTVNQIAIAPNDKYVFVACGTSGTLAFAFSPSSSDPIASAAYATIDPVNTSDGAALAIAVDPSTRLLYVGESAAVSSSGGLRTFSIGASGALTEISGSPQSSGGTGPHAILPKSTGDYVYVANWNGSSTGNITGFEISESDSGYTLTKLSTSVSTGIEPLSLAEDSNQNFVLAVSKSGSPYFDAYFFDSTTAGELDTTIESSGFAASSLAAQRY
jgi:6-phosphogluconolactonase (cycloisomerase 2 family)